MKRRWPGLSLLLLSLCAVAAGAQQAQENTQASTSTAFGRPRFMIYLFDAEPGTLSTTERFLLYNSILAAATEANPDVVLLESPDETVPQTPEAK